MAFDPEISCRIVIGLMIVGAGAIGLPSRLRADRAGGRVSPRVDPAWFWIVMAIVGPPMTLTCFAFLIQPRWVDFALIEIPPWSRLMGVPVAMLGLGLFRWMFRHLGQNVTSTSMP